MGRGKKDAGKSETPLYSREDIREQYCINNSRDVDGHDRTSRRSKGFFGCLTSRKDNPCKKKRSFFALCVRRASEENLYNGCNKPVANTNRSVTLPALKPFTVPLNDGDGGTPFRNRPQPFCTSDPRRYSMQIQPCVVNSNEARYAEADWKSNTLPIQRTLSDAQASGGAGHAFNYGGRLAYTQPNTPDMSAAIYRRQVMSTEALLDDRRGKHVSFDASSPTSEIYTSCVPANSKSLERLLDGRKTPEFAHPHDVQRRKSSAGSSFSPVLAKAILLERLRQASMRSQATQTDGYYNSNTSLSMPSYRSDSHSSMAATSEYTITRQVQTNFEPRRLNRSRLSKSFSEMATTRSTPSVRHHSVGDADDADDDVAPPPAAGSLGSLNAQPGGAGGEGEEGPEVVTGSRKGRGRSSGSAEAQSRRRQKLKALSEGTILLDRRKALRFASGYVDVNLRPEEPEEEATIGRVVVYSSVHPPPEGIRSSSSSSSSSSSASSDEESQTDDTSGFRPLLPVSAQDLLEGIPQLESISLKDLEPAGSGGVPVSQKSFDSGGSVPGTPDEFGSTSQVTVLQRHLLGYATSGSPSSCAILSDSEVQQPEAQRPEVKRPEIEHPQLPQNPSATPIDVNSDENESDREIMVQFPPWPQADTLIPAPPNFASAADLELPHPQPEPQPEAGPEVCPQPEPELQSQLQLTQRMPLKQLKDSKNLSETMTSVDSDSSGRRMTEHETSSSGVQSPEIFVLPEDLSSDKIADSGDNSDTFLTALSEHQAGTGSNHSGNSGRRSSFRESDTSHNSTLRTDGFVSPPQGIDDLPLPPPPVLEKLPEPLPAAEATLPTTPDADYNDSSTSGSYSLETSPPLDSLPDSIQPVQVEPEYQSRNLEHPEAEVKEEEAEVSTTNLILSCPPEFLPEGPEVLPLDKKKMKEAMKLQFSPGTTMFDIPNSGAAAASASTPSGSGKSGRRRLHHQHQSMIQDSSPEETPSERLVRKRRNKTTTTADASSERVERVEPKRNLADKTKNKKSRSQSPSVRTPEAGSRKCEYKIAPEEPTTPGMVRSPAMHEGFRLEDWIVDRLDDPPEASGIDNQPEASGIDNQPEAAVFILQRPSHSSLQEEQTLPAEVAEATQWLPAPSTLHLEAESIRSTSPAGSDNVFVAAAPEAELPDQLVFRPPEGFADSPGSQFPPPDPAPIPAAVEDDNPECGGAKRKRDSGRNKRAKSCTLPQVGGSTSTGGGDFLAGSTKSLHDGSASGASGGPNRAASANEMWYPETHLPPKRQLTVRARSEERERWNRPTRRTMEDLAKSVDTSWELLPSKLNVDGTPLEDEDAGIYNTSYRSAAWAYIGETEELQVWQRSQPQPPSLEADDSSTASEKDFRRKYTSITHRMVHRKSSVEMFRRLATRTFECDDIVLVRRESGEFGFRIHGSRPVVVSAIEPATPAEISGLHVGDIIISINDVNVLDSSHSDVVRIAHAGTDELKLEVARTCHVLAMDPTTSSSKEKKLDDVDDDSPILVGYLWKKSQSSQSGRNISNASGDDTTAVGAAAAASIWHRRWFSLRRDNYCLYYYKNQDSTQPLGAISLTHYSVARTCFTDRPHGLVLSKGGSIRHWLAAESSESVELWQSVLNHASRSTIQDVWLDVCTKNIMEPATSIASPDCVGHLMKLGHRAKEWQRRFCLLKDACLYFYVDIGVGSALGALHLHGYRLQSSGTASSGERRKFAFELLPPESRMRHFHFYTDSENDRKRWIAALEYSIDRWIKIG